jgi:hypothetical protein
MSDCVDLAEQHWQYVETIIRNEQPMVESWDKMTELYERDLHTRRGNLTSARCGERREGRRYMKWISVKDRLPEIGQEFLATMSADDYEIDHFIRSGKNTVYNRNSANIQVANFWNIMRWWMPLPEPPEIK